MSDKKVTKPLTVRLDEDLLDNFKNVCEREGYSQTFVIKELLKKYLSGKNQGDLFKG